MADIVVALETLRQWEDFRRNVHRKDPTFLLWVRAAYWRRYEDQWPHIKKGEQVWICWNTMVRGHAPIIGWEQVLGTNDDWNAVLDLREFIPEGVPWRFNDDFRRSWRVMKFGKGQYPSLFNPIESWEWEGKLTRAEAVARKLELAQG